MHGFDLNRVVFHSIENMMTEHHLQKAERILIFDTKFNVTPK